MKVVNIGNIKIGEGLVLIAGPCVIENEEITYRTASCIKKITDELEIPFIFKSSYDKANRSRIDSYRGPGLEEGLRILSLIKRKLNIPITTDVHCRTEVDSVREVADLIQIPAFLCRQTDLILSCAKTGLPINIKKGQFMSPQDMRHVIQKVESVKDAQIILTERGTFFGYNNLVVDFKAIPVMQGFGWPVIFDATHSALDANFVPCLVRCAVACGVNGLFLEVHPNPKEALCDSANMVNLDDLYNILRLAKKLLLAHSNFSLGSR
ncbi:TPA: 3-deoxy-8-phosphooctulonate synthase [bacterium]|nr:3-deoxy-8-phosphooctulonate synthase [bacterium]